MTLEPASQTPPSPKPRRKVLVFGAKPGFSDRIARQLQAEGLEPILPGLTDDRLPLLSDPEAVPKLHDILGRFAISLGAAEGPYAHYIHPGLSAWADRPELITIAQQHGLTVISPPPKVLALFANRLNLLVGAERLGIPNLMVGSPEQTPMHSLREIEAFIEETRQRFPFILKSAKGGNRFGLIVVHEARELESRLQLWMDQLRRNYGEVILFPERYLEAARHIVVPFVRFVDGRGEVFPMIDSSLQSRQRKVIELCPAAGLEPEAEARIRQMTLDLAAACGYIGVGSLEFLVDGPHAYLIGGSARLNTGFHLWEKVAGTHAVSWQLAAMQGGAATLPPVCKPEKRWQAAVALRLYAEDSVLQLPQPGRLHEASARRHWDFPSAEAKLDLALSSGEDVGIDHHGLIGMIWAGAQSRALAMTTVRGVLDEVWLAGSLQTNERFLSEILLHPWVREGIFHTGFIDEEFLPSLRPPMELARLIASALLFVLPAGRNAGYLPDVALDAPSTADLAAPKWAVGDQWIRGDRSLVAWVEGPSRFAIKDGVGEWTGLAGALRVPDGRALRFCAYPIGPDRWQARLGSWVLATRRGRPRGGADALKDKPRARSGPKIASLVPGRVHSVLFREGAVVPAHEPLLVIESLGMLVPHALPVDVMISRWKVASQERVRAGQDLADFEILAKP